MAPVGSLSQLWYGGYGSQPLKLVRDLQEAKSFHIISKSMGPGKQCNTNLLILDPSSKLYVVIL